jgi:hypothetical protein
VKEFNRTEKAKNGNEDERENYATGTTPYKFVIFRPFLADIGRAFLLPLAYTLLY